MGPTATRGVDGRDDGGPGGGRGGQAQALVRTVSGLTATVGTLQYMSRTECAARTAFPAKS